MDGRCGFGRIFGWEMEVFKIFMNLEQNNELPMYYAQCTLGRINIMCSWTITQESRKAF